MLTKDFLEREYLSLGKSSNQIAKDLGLPRHAVTNALARHRIPMRPIRLARKPKASAGLAGHKWCPSCRADLPFEDFCKGRSAGKLNPYCRRCQAVKAQKFYPVRIKRRQRAKAEVVIRMGDRCAACGISGLPLACYQFHHRDPSVKERNMYHVITPGGVIYPEEIDKCDLLCGNCHAVHHHGPATASEILRNSSIK